MTKQTLLGMAVSSVVMPGTVIGGRFVAEGLATSLGTLMLYHATDQKTQRKVVDDNTQQIAQEFRKWLSTQD